MSTGESGTGGDVGPGSPSPLPEAEPRFSSAEREAMQAAWTEEMRRGGPRDPQMTGCGIAFVGMVLLAMTPAVGRLLEIPPGVAQALLLVGAGSLFLGALWSLLLRTIRGGSPELLECLQAARYLRENAGVLQERSGREPVDPVVQRGIEHAVRFLRSAFTVNGPSTTQTPGLARAVKELGEGRSFLTAVERVLGGPGGCYPVVIPPRTGGRLP